MNIKFTQPALLAKLQLKNGITNGMEGGVRQIMVAPQKVGLLDFLDFITRVGDLTLYSVRKLWVGWG